MAVVVQPVGYVPESTAAAHTCLMCHCSFAKISLLLWWPVWFAVVRVDLRMDGMQKEYEQNEDKKYKQYNDWNIHEDCTMATLNI